ncbi:unnamed protein product, partial [marine sediment metagenome]
TGHVFSIFSDGDALTGDLMHLNLDGDHTLGQGFVLEDNGGGAVSVALASITNLNAARTTGDLLDLVNAQTAFVGDAFNIALTGNSLLQQAIVVTEAGGGDNTNDLTSIACTNAIRTAGTMLAISYNGAGNPYTGTLLTLDIGAASTQILGGALTATDAGTGNNTADFVTFTSTNAIRTAGSLLTILGNPAGAVYADDLVTITIGAASTQVVGSALFVEDLGTGANLDSLVHIQNGAGSARTTGELLEITNAIATFTGDAFNIALTGNSILQQAIVVTEAGAGDNTADLASIACTNAIRTAGTMLSISYNGAGNPYTGTLLTLNIGAASTQILGSLLVATDAGTGNNTDDVVTFTSTNAIRTAGSMLNVLFNGAGAVYADDAVVITLGAASTQVAGSALFVEDLGTGANLDSLVHIQNGAGSARTTG